MFYFIIYYFQLLNFIELNLEVCLGKNRKYIALWISAVGLVNPFRVVSDLSEVIFKIKLFFERISMAWLVYLIKF